MIYYIAGPMTGMPDGNRPAFHRAAAGLRAEGHTVLDPALLPMDLDDKAYLPICTAMIDAADAVYLLDRWQSSMGAVAEQNYALRQGKLVRYADMDPVEEVPCPAPLCIGGIESCAADMVAQKLTAALKERDALRAQLTQIRDFVERSVRHDA